VHKREERGRGREKPQSGKGPLSEQQRPSLRVAEERGRGKRTREEKEKIEQQTVHSLLHRCHIFFVLFVSSSISDVE
jgi:hypothetical protein